MKIAIIGTGFVGVTSSVVYASFGNQVTGLDIDEKKVASLNQGKVPFYEPKLAEMLASGLESGNLTFTTNYQKAIVDAQVIIVAVGTPSRDDGSIDLSYVEASVAAAAPYLADGAILAIKSTVLPGTLAKVKQIVTAKTDHQVYYASLPEFLKEGTAVDDTLYPDRVVIGVEDDNAFEILKHLHEPLKAPILHVRPESAQLIKYASNNYLALRIVYANVLAEICEHTQADIDEVIAGMGYEKRIGSHYWYPGVGYGGSCFPKDVKALAHFVSELELGRNLFATMNELNEGRPTEVINHLIQNAGDLNGKTVAVLGLSFKPNTDDQREAPALAVIPRLLELGAKVKSFDPMVKEIASAVIAHNSNYQQVGTIDDAIKEADIIIALIEWPQIIGYNFGQLKSQSSGWFFDTRNQFDEQKIKKAGFKYLSVGRK